jgi:hypothetical protein
MPRVRFQLDECAPSSGSQSSSIATLNVMTVSAETSKEIAAKTMLGWPLLAAAPSINCIRRLEVIPGNSGVGAAFPTVLIRSALAQIA